MGAIAIRSPGCALLAESVPRRVVTRSKLVPDRDRHG
jgi:hypothetical protein